jgi:hypothetical protein
MGEKVRFILSETEKVVKRWKESLLDTAQKENGARARSMQIVAVAS